MNFITRRKDIQGVIYVLLAYFCFSLLNIVTKRLYGTLNVMDITFFRSLFCIFITAPICMFKSKEAFNIKNLYKGTLDFLSIPLWAVAVCNMNIPEAVGLSYLTPIFTAFLAIIFLKDYFTLDKWIGMALGLVGAYIILNPKHFNIYSINVIGCCILWATGYILTKNLTNNQSPIFIVLYTNIVICSLSSPFYMQSLYKPTLIELGNCILVACCASCGYLCLSYACKATKLSNLVPFDYFRLIFSSYLAYIFLDHSISIRTIIGSLLIFGSSLYLARQKIQKYTANETV